MKKKQSKKIQKREEKEGINIDEIDYSLNIITKYQ